MVYTSHFLVYTSHNLVYTDRSRMILTRLYIPNYRLYIPCKYHVYTTVYTKKKVNSYKGLRDFEGYLVSGKVKNKKKDHKMTKPELKQRIINVLKEHDIEKGSGSYIEYERGKKILWGLCTGGEAGQVIKILAEWVGV